MRMIPTCSVSRATVKTRHATTYSVQAKRGHRPKKAVIQSYAGCTDALHGAWIRRTLMIRPSPLMPMVKHQSALFIGTPRVDFLANYSDTYCMISKQVHSEKMSSCRSFVHPYPKARCSELECSHCDSIKSYLSLLPFIAKCNKQMQRHIGTMAEGV